jgi:AmmeMemoRadiSam system protein B
VAAAIDAKIRRPAVAGTFYPSDATRLTETIDRLLAAASVEDQDAPAALIAPHAGFMYSGPVAASAYALLARSARRVRRVLVIGPAHRAPLRGMALPRARALETPLGTIDVDQEAVAMVERMPGIVCDDRPHAGEHSLEVQLPFLQRVLGDFRVLPVVVGDAAADDVARVIDAFLGEADCITIVSSDLSHFLSYEAARELDRRTADRILAVGPRLDHDQACGASAINGLLVAARRSGLQPRLLDLRSSGDTAGSTDEVVGYAAFSFPFARQLVNDSREASS